MSASTAAIPRANIERASRRLRRTRRPLRRAEPRVAVVSDAAGVGAGQRLRDAGPPVRRLEAGHRRRQRPAGRCGFDAPVGDGPKPLGKGKRLSYRYPVAGIPAHRLVPMARCETPTTSSCACSRSGSGWLRRTAGVATTTPAGRPEADGPPRAASTSTTASRRSAPGPGRQRRRAPGARHAGDRHDAPARRTAAQPARRRGAPRPVRRRGAGGARRSGRDRPPLST